jgi:hypothetical protein
MKSWHTVLTLFQHVCELTKTSETVEYQHDVKCMVNRQSSFAWEARGADEKENRSGKSCAPTNKYINQMRYESSE